MNRVKVKRLALEALHVRCLGNCREYVQQESETPASGRKELWLKVEMNPSAHTRH